MALDFKVKDIIHKVTAKFVHAFLPTAKKPYNLRAVFQPELDIHGMYPPHKILPKAKRPRQLPQSVNHSALVMYLLHGICRSQNFPSNTTNRQLLHHGMY
jgi:hypothetical protein